VRGGDKAMTIIIFEVMNVHSRVTAGEQQTWQQCLGKWRRCRAERITKNRGVMQLGYMNGQFEATTKSVSAQRFTLGLPFALRTYQSITGDSGHLYQHLLRILIDECVTVMMIAGFGL